MSKKSNLKQKTSMEICSLSLGKYNNFFECLELGKTKNLKDVKSEKNASIPIKVNDKNVYMAEPDGGLIPNIPNQHKCDFLVYCQDKAQICFIELKGATISTKEKYNPYGQIIGTIKFLQQEDSLKCLVEQNIEKHAFIVSPGRQKIPKGSETMERQLWQKLCQRGKVSKIPDLVHYVKVTKSERYSSNNGKIICSPESPVVIPFSN